MKLLGKAPNRTARILPDSVRREIKLKKVIEAAEKEGKLTKEKVDAEKLRLGKDLLSFSEECTSKKNTLLREVEELEKRKEAALEPLDDKWLELSEWEAELEEVEKKQDTKDKEIAILINETASKQKFLREKEISLANREVEVLQKERQANDRERSINEKEGSLSFRMERFEQEERARREELSERELRVDQQNYANLTIRDSLEDERRQLERDRIKIEDQRSQLKVAWTEICKQNEKQTQ